MNILFMGTPDFASECLDALIKEKMNVSAVFTQPDKKRDRGMKLSFSDVKKYALEKEIPVYQPETFKNEAAKELIEKINPDLIVVVAYGKILPKYVLEYPKYGCINVHGSLLPGYRGAAPIQRAVLNGEKVSGVTTMLMDEGMDTGDILLTEKVEIGENTTTGELFDILAKMGGELLVKTIRALESGKVTPVKQQHELATHAEKITSEECLVCFNDFSENVHNKIRGLSPFPGAFCYLDGKIIKLYDSVVCDTKTEHDTAGKVLEAGKDGVEVACSKGSIVIRKFKPEGKGILTANDLVNGRKISKDSVFASKND